MIEFSELQEECHYVCELKNGGIAVLEYHGDNKFSCNQTTKDLKCIHKVVPNPMGIMTPEMFQANIANLPEYKNCISLIKNEMLKGNRHMKCTANNTYDLMSKDIVNLILNDLASQGWWGLYEEERRMHSTTHNFYWSEKKFSFFNRMFCIMKGPKKVPKPIPPLMSVFSG